MRIAAGVLLIIAAVFNVIAGAGYGLTGGVASVGTDLVNEAAKEAAKEGAATADVKEAQEALGKVGSMGAGLMYFGFFLMAMFVVQIVAGIMCFISKGKMFVFIAAALSIIAELGGIFIIAFGWTNIIGLVAGVLAFLSAMKFGQGGGAAPAPTAPAA